ncbi:MBOAT family protein [Rhodopseudomonas sp. P2A-2r]|uniref:MBOAT family O-acyltransferase n=1 Tax=Rhodopseudomonas sp. P2A-2r TaxID=2991972 RepID=UPI0022343592|nr:MBOAT family O-acyltransferase [Rhodopseudomonas sp. P2A-2r]UZE48095.1 MBOAT family protein [Rhodopseudomonas sp. P2A-2r]
MSFSSPGFMFAFMPVFFACYFAVPLRLRNGLLMLASLLFYSIDGGVATWVLIASIVVNYIVGLAIELRSLQSLRSLVLLIGIVLNFIPLLYYKYWNFLVSTANDIRGLTAGGGTFSMADILLPAGISFFTFQGLSYIVDIYRRECCSARTIVDFGMYHTLFPQLVAGPIVRYREVEPTIVNRPVAMNDVEQGIFRFCIGLAKKIIIADNMGVVADSVFNLAAGQLTTAAAWVGALAYTLQIFFDFSGYSDMAIGLGRALGFRFPENFDQPYRSLSITEFWRRWHMTLSRWFRDYVYIPLGGNRRGHRRTYFNLLVVFVLCGLWHGAAYTFLLWGLYHGALLVAERAGGGFLLARLPPLLAWAVTLLLVIVGWVFFEPERSTTR